MTDTAASSGLTPADRLLALAATNLSATDPAAVLNQIVETAAELIPDALGGSVVLWNATTETYSMAATSVPGQESQETTKSIRSREGSTRWIIDTGEPLYVAETKGHRFGDGSLITRFGVRAFAGLPIKADTRVLGVLYVLVAEPRAFADDDKAVLGILADRAAAAIELASQVEEMQAVAAAHRDAVFRARQNRKRADATARAASLLMHMTDPDHELSVVLNTIGQALAADRVLTVTLDPTTDSVMDSLVAGIDSDKIVVGDYQELMGGLTGWAIDNDKTAVSDSADARESAEARERRTENGSGPLVVVPMQYSDGKTGTLTVVRRQGKAPFAPAEVSTIEVMASQLMLATDRLRLLEENRRLAHTDELTGLPNRRQLEQVAEEVFKASERYDRPMSVLLIDANDFKAVNDRFGHAAGDQSLIAIANACRQGAREADVIGRLGGDEFVAVLPETAREGALVVAERIIDQHDDVHTSLAIGVATIRPSDTAFGDVLERADSAMYAAKDVGGNAVI